MKPLESPDIFYLQAAQGWLQLGNPTEASLELENISSCKQRHPEVLNARWEVCAAARNWVASLEIASRLIRLEPEDPLGWVHRSYALHELKRTSEARHSLLSVLDRFPDSATIRYNLASYDCQFGRLDQAKNWLREAFALGDAKKMKLMALGDSELEPPWKDIGRS